MKRKPIALLAAVLLPLSTSADTFIVDFNDVEAIASADLRDALNDGGIARDGGSFTGGYDANTGLVHTFPGDLTVSNTGYTATQGAATFNGPFSAGFVDTLGRARWQHRNIADFATGTTWISFIVNLDPDADADGEGVCFAGIMIGNGFNSGAQSDPDAIPGAAYLGLTYIPTQHTVGMVAPETYLEYSPSEIDFTNLTTTQANTLRGTTSADLGLAANTSYLVIAKLDAGANQIDVWIDPADATSEGTLGAADLTTTLNLPNITCYGMGGFADDDGLTTEEHVECKVDAIRISNTPIAYAWVTTNVEPLLEIDGSSANTNYAFGGVFGGSGSRSVTFVNNSPNAAETIDVVGLTFPANPDGVYSAGAITYDGGNAGTPPQLLNGDKVTVEIIATSAAPGTFLGEALLDTTSSGSLGADVNDVTFALSSTLYVSGQKLNDNALTETNTNGWGGGPTFVTPGIAPGSLGMMRVKGVGDPNGGFPDSAYQATGIPNGSPDWQMTCYFTPIDPANFAAYADADGSLGLTGPDGSFTDRTFQWTLQSATNEDAGGGQVPNPAFGDAHAAVTLVNIAYLPDGNTSGGTPDFYVFDNSLGSFGEWVATGIGAIAGSIDNDTDADPLNGFGDGLLDTTVDPSDSINVYRMVVTGTAFGTGAASYTIDVAKASGSDTFVSGTSGARTEFHGKSGTTDTPTGHAFLTSDLALSSSNFGDGVDPGLVTPFWVDDACFFTGTAPDPLLTFLSNPATTISAFGTPTGTTGFRVRSDGNAASLNITSIAFDDPAFTLTGALPGALAPGAFADIEVQFDSAVSGPLVVGKTMTISSDDSLTPVTVLDINGSTTSYAKLTANWDFETAGTDNITDVDTFAIWDEAQLTETNVVDVPGLVAGSTTAALLRTAGGTSEVEQAVSGNADNFTIDLVFAINTGGGRLFNIVVRDGPSSNGQINIRYEGTSFDAFNNVTGTGWEQQIDLSGTPLVPSEDNDSNGSLDDVGDVKSVYRLRITGHSWFGGSPTWDLEVFDAAGTPIASNLGSTSFQNSTPADGLGLLEITTAFGGGPGFWVDEVCAAGSAFSAAPVITAFSIDPATGNGSVTFVSEDGINYELRASADASATDPFSANLVTSGPGTGTSTTLNFTDAAAVGQVERYYRIERP